MTTEKILKLQSTIVECEAVIELQEKKYTVLKNNKDELEKEYDEIINVLKNKVKELTEEINDLQKANKNLFDENCILDNTN
jgi:phage host-nuclease inhibitor protein Gam